MLKKKSVEEWDDLSKMKRLINLKMSFEEKEFMLKEDDGGKVGTTKELYRKKS